MGMSVYAHFERLPRCQYGVYCYNTEEGTCDCDEPATSAVYWYDDKRDLMYVCEKHACFIEESELNV